MRCSSIWRRRGSLTRRSDGPCPPAAPLSRRGRRLSPAQGLRWSSGETGPRDDEVICHGDFGPWNIVSRGERPAGILDWDYARPRPRLHDIAYALEYVAPFCTRPARGPGRRRSRLPAGLCRLTTGSCPWRSGSRPRRRSWPPRVLVPCGDRRASPR
ncbi:phosphotransferase [Nonomuraea sp. NPDC049400]|uniref:phosphotransferase n=1 Tax=Nonomuraea sp. NPDC049400 TaxID=3364352 RepID=UPI00379437EB